MVIPELAFHRRLRAKRLLVPTAVGVLTREDGSVVLFDVGFSRAELDDPKTNLGLVRSALFKVEGTGADSAVSQLARMGIGAERVTTIVATHLHLDHIGGFVDFPNAEIVAPAAEFASGRERGMLGGYAHVTGLMRSGRARPVMLRDVITHAFPRFLDLFEDGTVLLLDARGHTAGSVAILVTRPDDGQVLMIGDAAYTSQELASRRSSPLARLFAFNQEWLRATWGRIAAFERQNPEVPVVPSHCTAAWDRLHQH